MARSRLPCPRLAQRATHRCASGTCFLIFLTGGVLAPCGCGGRSALPAPWRWTDESASPTGSPGAGGEAGDAGTAGAAGQGGDYARGCVEGLPGPPVVEVPDLLGGTYCIDATEVTNHHYAEWLATSPSLQGQPEECYWNETFVPYEDWPPATDRADHPVAWVDWCDATAYCGWARKRLCGRVGGGNGYEDWSDPSRSEWMNACTAGGVQGWPYGDSYDPTACNVPDSGISATLPVGSSGRCEGGFSGLFDLVGNVYEWTNACTEHGTAYACVAQGGSFFPSLPPACDTAVIGGNVLVGAMFGIRCCRDAERQPP